MSRRSRLATVVERPGVVWHQAGPREPLEGLAHRGAAHPEPRGEVTVAQLLARGQGAVDDGVAQPRVHVVAEEGALDGLPRRQGSACNILHIAARRASSGDRRAKSGCSRAVASAMLTSMHVTDLPPGLTARPLTPDDLDAAYAVYAAAELEDAGHLAIEPEDIAGDWARPSFDLAPTASGCSRADRLRRCRRGDRGGARAEGAVLPGERGRGIGSWLAAWTEERATSLGPSRVGQMAPDGSTAAPPAARSRLPRWGTRRGCSSCPRGARWRTGAARRVLAGHGGPAEREHGGPRVVQDAFDEWEGRARESFDDWAATTVRRPGHRAVAAARRRARRGRRGRVVHDPRQPGRCGYVHQLAVERAHRGRAWRRRCSPTRSASSRERGATRSELSTDSRTGALDLYLKVGMEVTQTWTAPGDRPAPRTGVSRQAPRLRTSATYWSRASSALVPCDRGPRVVLGAADRVGEPGALALHVALGRLLVERVELQLGVVAGVAREGLDALGGGVELVLGGHGATLGARVARRTRQRRLRSSSATCTALSAAPLRRLSPTTKRLRPLPSGAAWSARTRPT